MKIIRRFFLLTITICLTFCASLTFFWHSHIVLSKPYGIAHFSIDDTMSLFIDLTHNQYSYSSIFENDILYELKTIHEKYNAKFSFYCFYEQGGFNLSMVTDRFHDEFQENKDWLCFGYHAKNSSTELAVISREDIVSEYRSVTSELNRITGSVTNTLRLSCYHGNVEAINAIANEGVHTLFTNSKNKLSYYLNHEQMRFLKHNDLFREGDITFIHTDVCLDQLSSSEARFRVLCASICPKQNDMIVIFTHEPLLDRKMLQTIESICGFLSRHGYRFNTEIYEHNSITSQ